MFERFAIRNEIPGSIGLPSNQVSLATYSDQWPELFHSERKRVALAMDPLPVSIAHIGSTSVPGMTAKPIIDILVGLQQPVHSIPVQLTLQSIGYHPHGEKGVPGRLFFTAGDPSQFHLHLVEHKGHIWEDHLLFREQLIQLPGLARDYIKIKRELAERFPSDRESYTRGKANFIENAIREATKSS